MLITQKQADNLKMSDASNNANNKHTKLQQKCVAVKNCYNKHFPTDRKTFNLRVPFVGLVLSILVLHFVSTTFAIRWFMNRSENSLIGYCYIFVATAVGYELYYGLKIGDRKQFTPWILLKLIELCMTFATIIYVFVEHSSTLSYHVPDLFYGIILLGLNTFVTYIVAKISYKQLRGYGGQSDGNKETDDNIYDTYTYDNA